MEDHRLGKLKRTIKHNCPDCGKKTMQIRVVSEELVYKHVEVIITETDDEVKLSPVVDIVTVTASTVEEKQPEYVDVEYLYCPCCEYEELYGDKKPRWKYNQREEEEELWTSSHINSYEMKHKQKSQKQSQEHPKGYRKY